MDVRPPKFLWMSRYSKSPSTTLSNGSAKAVARTSKADVPLVDAGAGLPGEPARPRRLLDQLRDEIRLRHYSIRTEAAYVDWARRFILFHGKRHPCDMGVAEVQAFLTDLAVGRGVSSATQSQAKSALLFLYKEVLHVQLPWLDEIVSAKRSERLPVVLTPTEVRSLLHELNGVSWLIAGLLYGTGMRLLEGLRLRVKDVEFERRELIVRDGKGSKDRVTVLPENLLLPLKEQLARAKVLHDRDLAAGFGAVLLPDALAVKYPKAASSWGWQWVFPSTMRSIDPRSGVERRHHLHESSVQKSVTMAARRAQIVKPCSPHVLRHSFPTVVRSGGRRPGCNAAAMPGSRGRFARPGRCIAATRRHRTTKPSGEAGLRR